MFASDGHNEKGILRKNMELKLRDEFIKLGQAMKAAASDSFGYTEEELVSSDIVLSLIHI